MPGDNNAFFRLTAVVVVRNGGEVTKYGAEYWAERHRQICANYNVLPDVLEMNLDDIEYFYVGIIETLKKATESK